MSSDHVIDVDSVSKCYAMYERPSDRLKQALIPRLGRLLGLPSRSYAREIWALRDVSFSVSRGETLAIIGRNGSGKSTLLQIICGTLTQSAGQSRTMGRVAALLELGAGFNPEFSGEENIRLSALLYGISESRLSEVFDSIVAFSDLGDFIRNPVKTYSSGMYVRLAFAIAAHVDAEVLIIDEALSVGDVRFSQKCARFLRDFQQKGTLLFVSHDTSAVLNLCRRAIWLEQGVVVMDDAAKAVVEAYLAAQHAQDRASGGANISVRIAKPHAPAAADNDARQALALASGLRPELTVTPFSFEPSIGDHGERNLEIVHAELVSAATGEAKHLLGGEPVRLLVDAQVRSASEAIIFGFYVKDRLGQRLFGDNTYLSYLTNPVAGLPGQRLRATFEFRMPVMPAAEYTIDVAVATGSQESHTQQHWLHDVLSFRSTDMTMKHGLVGIPMRSITIDVMDPS